jgi:hypothetical protein
MSDKLEISSKQLVEQVRTAESCLTTIRQHLIGVRVTPLATFAGLLQEATARVEAASELAQQASQRLNAALENKRQSPPRTFNSADLPGEVLRHEDEADTEEALAADALLVATQSIRQAEVVILNALKARITALDLARYRDTF